jgi:iduronate 2-sulfatase
VSYPGINQPGAVTQSMVETLDLFPTLCELTDLPMPDFVNGVSLKPQLQDPNAPGHPAIAYTGRATTIRHGSHRMILHKDGFVELYDHSSAEKETRNIAPGNEALVTRLSMRLSRRLQE